MQMASALAANVSNLSDGMMKPKNAKNINRERMFHLIFPQVSLMKGGLLGGIYQFLIYCVGVPAVSIPVTSSFGGKDHRMGSLCSSCVETLGAFLYYFFQINRSGILIPISL
jgi:hypothetical protein